MEKPKPGILQIKAPSKWDILKTKAKFTKEYLKGNIIKGTEVKAVSKMPIVSMYKFDDKEFTKKYRIMRKRINKLKYKSRRKNRR